MSEALILYRGRGGVDPELLKPTTITSNGNYVAPVTGNYMVYTVGGGGGGGGGCRNSWNSSQVFYGAGGSRGALNTKTVFLNAGDQVTVTLGAGGSGGANNTTVVSNNSRGTSGSTGSTTTFGSHVSAVGGYGGSWSWSYHYWNNVITDTIVKMGWGTRQAILVYNVGHLERFYANGEAINHATMLNINANYTVYIFPTNNSGFYTGYVYNTKGWYVFENTTMMGIPGSSFNQQTDLWQFDYTGTSMSVQQALNTNMVCPHIKPQSLCYNSNAKYYLTKESSIIAEFKERYSYYPEHLLIGFNQYAIYNNEYKWNNTVQNITARCYTSIQQGSWWYQNNNQVSTSGTRTYRGDGGASGQAGNAGFILVIPPQS